jgi:hypothetical protein
MATTSVSIAHASSGGSNPEQDIQTAFQSLSETDLDSLCQAFCENIDDVDFGNVKGSLFNP